MNSLSPPIFPDNTEVNGKMKMKCLNVNGDNITEIITGPKITYREGERSFLKSISIDGYRVTISYIDDLFQGSVVTCFLKRDGQNVAYLYLYPNGDINISGEAYTLVDKSWKTISFNIDTDIQDGYIRRQNNGKSVSFDFVLPSPSDHTLYSSFISDMKYISGNTEVTKIIDGGGKNDDELLNIANNNKPCLIISYSPSSSAEPNILTLVLNNSTTPSPVVYKAISSVPEPMSLRRSAPQESEPERLDPWVLRHSVPLRALNDRVDELEYKLRKFGIN